MKYTKISEIKITSHNNNITSLLEIFRNPPDVIKKGGKMSEKPKTWKGKGDGVNVKIVASVKESAATSDLRLERLASRYTPILS